MLTGQEQLLLAVLVSSALAVMILNREIQMLMRRNSKIRMQLVSIATGVQDTGGAQNNQKDSL